MKYLFLTTILLIATGTPSVGQQMFTSEQLPMISEAVIVVRYANARCPEFGMNLSHGGSAFNELVKQAQTTDRVLMKMIFEQGERERPRLEELGYPLYCQDAKRRYPGMFVTD